MKACMGTEKACMGTEVCIVEYFPNESMNGFGPHPAMTRQKPGHKLSTNSELSKKLGQKLCQKPARNSARNWAKNSARNSLQTQPRTHGYVIVTDRNIGQV